MHIEPDSFGINRVETIFIYATQRSRIIYIDLYYLCLFLWKHIIIFYIVIKKANKIQLFEHLEKVKYN